MNAIDAYRADVVRYIATRAGRNFPEAYLDMMRGQFLLTSMVLYGTLRPTKPQRETVQQQIERDELRVVRRALKLGISPAEAMHRIAKRDYSVLLEV